ncbi:MAG TPA: pantoate--beta-alanine ligase [Solirubrobacteraceae bacterium]
MLKRVATGIPWELDRVNESIDLNLDQPMKTVRAVSELRLELESAWQTHQQPRVASRSIERSVNGATIAGHTIGLVPTMGALHEGHLSLIRRARQQCAVVVVSLFVNPAQFDERSDFDRYPDQEQRDAELAAAAGADILFVPSATEVYPAGFATSVEVGDLTDRLEGAVRGAAHFKGVTTVVTKLLNMVAPDVAYFGQKDAQQAVVIRRLVADLNLPVQIEICPTVREPDGLAMSSRNAHLRPDERERALALPRALTEAETAAVSGERSAEELLRVAREAMAAFNLQPEYLALVDPHTLEPVARLDEPALLAVAARIGDTRLIDNTTLQPVVRSNSQHPTPREAPATCSA